MADYGVEEMALLARTDEDRALIEKARAMAANAKPLTPEPDFPAPHAQVGDWLNVDPAAYEAYRRGEPGALEQINPDPAGGRPARIGSRTSSNTARSRTGCWSCTAVHGPAA